MQNGNISVPTLKLESKFEFPKYYAGYKPSNDSSRPYIKMNEILIPCTDSYYTNENKKRNGIYISINLKKETFVLFSQCFTSKKFSKEISNYLFDKELLLKTLKELCKGTYYNKYGEKEIKSSYKIYEYKKDNEKFQFCVIYEHKKNDTNKNYQDGYWGCNGNMQFLYVDKNNFSYTEKFVTLKQKIEIISNLFKQFGLSKELNIDYWPVWENFLSEHDFSKKNIINFAFPFYDNLNLKFDLGEVNGDYKIHFKNNCININLNFVNQLTLKLCKNKIKISKFYLNKTEELEKQIELLNINTIQIESVDKIGIFKIK